MVLWFRRPAPSPWQAPPAHFSRRHCGAAVGLLIVVDEMPPVIWIIAIGFWWTLGVLLQLAAGTVARVARSTGVTG
jgi:hypothetical protein